MVVLHIAPEASSRAAQTIAGIRERGYEPRRVRTLAEALDEFQAAPPDVVLLDAVPFGDEGLEVLGRLRAEWPEVPVVVLSTACEVGTVVRAIKAGAADFLAQPLTVEELELALRNVTEKRELQSEVRRLRHQLRTAAGADPEGGIFFAHSEAMRRVKTLIDQVADTDATVLIEGESGVGKGLVAQALHAHSARRDQPLVRVNCAALPTELLESELFGYERGAFTGAHRRKPGKFEFAHGGTLVLDEVGEIPLSLQAKLLHVLQDGAFARLGGAQDVRVDVRVIAATNRDLERAAAEGLFRQDLYYRLNVVKIPVPPLRERQEEIPVLAEYFLRKYAVQYRRPVQPLTPATLALMLEYPWPGNVRELENLVRRMVLLRQEGFVKAELARGVERAPQRVLDMPRPLPRIDADGGKPPSLRDLARTAAQETERALIEEALVKTRWNRREAAKILRISYRALRYKIQAYGLGNRAPNGNQRDMGA